MNILITGNDGLIGSKLCDFYLSKIHDARGFNKAQYNDFIYSGFSFTTYLERILNFCPDTIINCAAELRNPEKMFGVNTGFVINDILAYIKIYPKTKLIQIGSSSEYGKHDIPTSEKSETRVYDEYSATKAATTLLLKGTALKHNYDIKVIRPYSVFGENEKNNRYFKVLFNSFEQDEFLNIYKGVHDWIYIDDFVQGFDKVLNYHERGFDIINIGSGIQTSNFDVYKIFENYYKRPAKNVEIINEFYHGNSTEHWSCNTQYSRIKYGINIASDTLENGIQKMITKLKHQ